MQHIAVLQLAAIYNYLALKTKWFKTLLFVGITLLIFYLLFTRIDFFAVLDILKQVSIWYLLSAFLVLTVLSPLMSALRWQGILKSMNYHVSFLRCSLITVGIWPLSAISPSKSGDLLKAYSLKNEVPVSKVIGSVLTERVLDILSLATFSLVGAVLFRKLEILSIAIIILAGITLVFIIANIGIRLPIKEAWQEKLDNLLLSTRTFAQNKWTFVLIVFLTFGKSFAQILQAKILFHAVDVQVPLLFTTAALPIAIFVGLIPITLGGMGTRDSAIVFFFSSYASASQSLAVGILYSFFGYWLLSIIGLPLMRRALRMSGERL
jgi:uncharacterized membrane protein YbhN (UPF0104 family)